MSTAPVLHRTSAQIRLDQERAKTGQIGDAERRQAERQAALLKQQQDRAKKLEVYLAKKQQEEAQRAELLRLQEEERLEDERRRKAEFDRLEAERQQKLRAAVRLQAAEDSTDKAADQAAQIKYSAQVQELEAQEEAEQVYEEKQEQRAFDSIAKQTEAQDQVLTSLSRAEDVAIKSAQDSELNAAQRGFLEAWLARVNPLAATTRKALADAIARLRSSLASVPNQAEKEVVEQQIEEMETQLKEVDESESSLFSSLNQFSKMGQQSLEFITDFMRNFFKFLKQKMDKVLQFFYTVFIDMIPTMAAKISSAILDPLYKLVGYAWKGIKWTGQKIAAFGNGLVSAGRYLTEMGGDIATSTWSKLKDLYGATSSAAGVAAPKVSAVLHGTANVIWTVSKAVGGATKYLALTLVGGVWKAVTSPKLMLVVNAVVKYVNAIWTDPIWGKFIIEVFSAARSTICERVSNYFYTATFEEIDASSKALENFNSISGKLMDLGSWGVWQGATQFLTGGGLKRTMLKAGEGFATGLAENISAKTILSGLPLVGGLGTVLGGAIDSAVGSVVKESVQASAEAMEMAAKVSQKKAILLEQWDFWVAFFTEDCVYPRKYTYNPEGWTRSTVDFVTGGWFARAGKPDVAGQRRPPLTQEHIDLENKLREYRSEILPREEKQLGIFEEMRKNRTWQASFSTEQQFLEQLASQTVLVNNTRSFISDGEVRTMEMLQDARERQHLESTEQSGKGLWNALGLPNTLREASQAVLPKAADQWIFLQSDLRTANADAALNKYLSDYNQLIQKTQQRRVEMATQLDAVAEEMKTKMAALKTQQTEDNAGSWNPFSWNSQDDPSKYSEKSQAIAKEIQALNDKLLNLEKESDQLDNSYLQMMIRLSQKGKVGSFVSEAEIKELEAKLAPFRIPAASPPPAPTPGATQ